MSLRPIFLANAILTGVVGVSLALWGYAAGDLSGARVYFGAALAALAAVVYTLGALGEAHFLRLAAGRLNGAYILLLIPIDVQAFASVFYTHPFPGYAWMVAASLFYVMALLFGFEAYAATSLTGILKLRSTAEARAEWHEEIRETAVRQERNRLAQDLHDSVKQQLFSIQTNLAAAQARWETDMPSVQSAIAQAREAAREASAEIAGLIDQLEPSPLESVGLVEALRRQCEALRLRTGAEVIANLGELPPLDPETQTVVFRVGQEALSNVARHARARRVEVELAMNDQGEALLRVRDDGQGLRPIEFPRGSGLRNMRKRAEEIGGSLTVEAEPGQGCTVSLRFRPREYVLSRRETHRKAIRAHAARAAIVTIPFLLGLFSRPSLIFLWIMGPMSIVEAAAVVYHTRKYLYWKGQQA